MFGIAMRVTGEYITRLPPPYLSPFSPFLDTKHIAAQADALMGWSLSQVRYNILLSSVC